MGLSRKNLTNVVWSSTERFVAAANRHFGFSKVNFSMTSAFPCVTSALPSVITAFAKNRLVSIVDRHATALLFTSFQYAQKPS